MHWVRLCSLILILWSLTYSTPQWLPFETAVKIAHVKKKYVFMDFYADWCSFCKQMDQTTFKDSTVLKELNQNFISIKINVESEKQVQWNSETISQRELSDYLQIQQLPTILFGVSNDPNELEIIGSFSSFVDSQKMHDLLVYISSGSREKGLSLEEFIDGHLH